jgi:hypothetical protein
MFPEVDSVMVREYANGVDEGESESKIVIETLWAKDSVGEREPGFVANTVELDVDSAIRFEGLEISHTAWIDNAMFVSFHDPTDIAIVDMGDSIDLQSVSADTPLRSIIISQLSNFAPALHPDAQEAKGHC